MKLIPLLFPSSKVFRWLGCDSDGVGYYLHPLNLVWSEEGPEHDLQRFAAVTRRLRRQPRYWSRLIRTSLWRHTLVGCVCAMLGRPDNQFDNLFYRFQRGSFVSPQVCMTMGIVYPDKAIPCLTAYLDGLDKAPHRFKQIMAAQCVLTKLGVTRKDPVNVDTLDLFARGEAQTAAQVVSSQWAFWAERTGDSKYME